MWTYRLFAHVIAFALGVGIPVLIYAWLRNSLEGTINDLLGLPDAAQFYVRSFAIVVVLTGIYDVAEPLYVRGADPKESLPSHFMQYVWAVAGRVSVIFAYLSVNLLIFAAAVTILAAVLGSRAWNTKPS